jgi:hypothetical protein
MLPTWKPGGEGRHFQMHAEEKLQQAEELCEDLEGMSDAQKQAMLPGLLQRKAEGNAVQVEGEDEKESKSKESQQKQEEKTPHRLSGLTRGVCEGGGL